MNGSKDLVKQLVGAVCEQSGNVGKDVEVVIIPPAIYLGQVAEQGGERIT
ncbi:MAG TPA: triose-phosphate isomerase, partial [Marinobacter hydrocarbonoclasticus]|nr:triose-phosphate isomerase [Marinobacter nauticus]